jgi:mono/diheme cytochrome c family protein
MVASIIPRSYGFQFLLFAVISLANSFALAVDPQKREEEFQKVILPLVQRACIDCHQGNEPAGGLALQHFQSHPQVIKERSLWKKAEQRIRIGDMPPKDGPELSDPERKLLADWISEVVTEIDCGKTPNPGAVTLRRLNRVEYRNTVRDLLGVDYEPAKDFPGDDVGYGFDNIGDVLTLPPLLLEKYLEAAESITGQVLRIPEGGMKAELKPGSRWQVEGGGKAEGPRLMFYSQGTARWEETAPFPGLYTVKLLLGGDQAGDEGARLTFFVDDKPAKQLETKAPRQNPEWTSFTVRLKAGSHRFAVQFTNDFYVEAKDGQPAKDRNLYVDDCEIVGRKRPPAVAVEELPESHRRIMTTDEESAGSVAEAARTILSPLASRAFRRPVDPQRLDRLVAIVQSITDDGGSLEEGIASALQAILVSPHFVFKVEQRRSPEGNSEYASIDAFELATRLSYFLWSSMPDDPLLQRALSGELLRKEVLEQEAMRMLQDRRSNAMVENFAGQWLTLRKLDQFRPDPQRFPQWNDQIRSLLQRETLTFVAGVMREDQSVLTLLDADFTYVNEELAKYYGIPGIQGEQFRKVSVRDLPRRGLLTQGAILAVTSNPTRTSPVKRGKWILDNLLNQSPPAAPPGVPELEKGPLQGTLRQRMEQHRVDPACAGCHQLMDPLGFALENYDATGKWRTTEEGAPIDASGQLPNGVIVRNAGELIQHLKKEQGDAFLRCLTEKMLTYATGRGMEYFDRCAVDQISARVKSDEYRFSRLVREIVLSDPFLKQGDRQ